MLFSSVYSYFASCSEFTGQIIPREEVDNDIHSEQEFIKIFILLKYLPILCEAIVSTAPQISGFQLTLKSNLFSRKTFGS